jgi:cold shock CspA family protein
MSEKIAGQIEYYNPNRAFGFVIDNVEPHTKRFFHLANVKQGVPQAGLTAIYEAGRTEKGPVAVSVQVLGGDQ